LTFTQNQRARRVYAVVTRPQQDSHHCENLCSNRSLFDASPSVVPVQNRTGTTASRHVCSVEQVRSALSSLPWELKFLIGANRRQTVSRLVAAPPLLFRELLLKRRSHSLDLNPDRQIRHATGWQLRNSCGPLSRELPSLVSNFELKVALLSAVQRKSLTVCASVKTP
jgi:hypothetical protein